jgi:hypothetical protein
MCCDVAVSLFADDYANVGASRFPSISFQHAHLLSLADSSSLFCPLRQSCYRDASRLCACFEQCLFFSALRCTSHMYVRSCRATDLQSPPDRVLRRFHISNAYNQLFLSADNQLLSAANTDGSTGGGIGNSSSTASRVITWSFIHRNRPFISPSSIRAHRVWRPNSLDRAILDLKHKMPDTNCSSAGPALPLFARRISNSTQAVPRPDAAFVLRGICGRRLLS